MPRPNESIVKNVRELAERALNEPPTKRCPHCRGKGSHPGWSKTTRWLCQECMGTGIVDVDEGKLAHVYAVALSRIYDLSRPRRGGR